MKKVFTIIGCIIGAVIIMAIAVHFLNNVVPKEEIPDDLITVYIPEIAYTTQTEIYEAYSNNSIKNDILSYCDIDYSLKDEILQLTLSEENYRDLLIHFASEVKACEATLLESSFVSKILTSDDYSRCEIEMDLTPVMTSENVEQSVTDSFNATYAMIDYYAHNVLLMQTILKPNNVDPVLLVELSEAYSGIEKEPILLDFSGEGK